MSKKVKITSNVLMKLLSYILIFFYIFISSQNVTAQQQPSQEQTNSTQQAPPTSPHWYWDLKLRNRTGFRLEEPHTSQMSRTYLDLSSTYKLSDQWKISAHGRASYDAVGRLGYPRKVWFEPREFLVTGKVKAVSLNIGLQQTVWGQADGLRILDVINPLDYREFLLEDFLDSRRPLWTVKAEIPIEKGTAQFIWIPHFSPGRLPASTDEFGVNTNYLANIFAANNPNSPKTSFQIQPNPRPALTLKSSQLGFRYRQSFGSWDLTTNFFHGWEDTPSTYPTSFVPSATPTLKITTQFDRKTIWGGTASTNFGPVILRLEAGWNFNKAAFVTDLQKQIKIEKHGQFSGVAGLDYSPTSWLSLSGQYFLQFVAAPQNSLVLPRYNHLTSLYIRTNFFRESLKPEIFVLTGLNQAQYLVRPKLSYSINDHWSIGIGCDFLGGNKKNLFGFFSSNDRAILELKWVK